MELSELKLISASNIIRLRQSKGLTQAELGKLLNYSDKSISKWERGEAIPDAYTLLQIAQIFDVDVDYMLSSHDGWNEETPTEQTVQTPAVRNGYSAEVLIWLVIVSVWTAAITGFVVLWLSKIVCWEIFMIALPVSLLVLIILESIFYPQKNLQFFISAFVVSLFVMLYLLFPDKNLWQIFLIAAPSVAIVFLACNLSKKPIKLHKK